MINVIITYKNRLVQAKRAQLLLTRGSDTLKTSGA